MATELSGLWEREDRGGGRFRLSQFIRPIAYRNGNIFSRIVNTWINGDASFPHIVSAAPMLVYVAADGMRRICPTRDPAKYFEIGSPYIKPAGTWQKVNLGNATRNGNMVTWSTAQADVRVTMGGHFLKLDIPLKGGWQPPGGQFAFPIGLSGLTRQGTDIYDGATRVMSLNAPVVYDAANPEVNTRPIGSTLAQVGNQWYVLFTLPSLTGMAAPVIDPTLTLQPDDTTGIDCNIVNNAADTNNPAGADVLRDLDTYLWPGVIRYSFIKFDLSSLVGKTITDATLTLTMATQGVTGANHGIYAIKSVNSGWVEACTWNYANPTTVRWYGDSGGNGGEDAGCGVPGTDYNATAMGTWTTAYLDPAGTTYSITLNTIQFTSMVAANYGLFIARTDNAQNGISFASSGHATAGYRPKLVVNYVAGVPRQAMYYTRGRSV